MTAVKWRIAALCEQLADGELPRLLADAGAEAALRRVLDAVRAGEPGKVTLTDLDNLDDAAASVGIDGLTTGARGLNERGISTSLPGICGDGPHFAWVCPHRACTRVELDTPDIPLVCAISSQPLERRTQP